MALRGRTGVQVGRAVRDRRASPRAAPEPCTAAAREGGILQRGDAQREIESLANQIDLPVAQREIQGDFGMGRPGSWGAYRAEIGDAERQGRAHPDDAPRPVDCSDASSSSASPSLSMRVARSSAARPAWVSESRREVRANRATPRRASSRATALETVGFESRVPARRGRTSRAPPTLAKMAQASKSGRRLCQFWQR